MEYSVTSIEKNNALYSSDDPRKSGMNVLLFSDFNIAGQISLLWQMLNKYTIHKARFFLLNNDWAQHPYDILYNNTEEHRDLLRQLVLSKDLLHSYRFPTLIDNPMFKDSIKPDNCFIQYWGSDIRLNMEPIIKWHLQNNIRGLSNWDPTMLDLLSLFNHIGVMFDMRRIQNLPKKSDDVIRICHPSSNRVIKKTEIFLGLKEKLEKEYSNVEFILIENTPNDKCLEIKSQCDMTFDQISYGAYGLSAIESMALGHVVFTSLSNFGFSYHPDMPVVSVDETTVEQKIRYFIENPEKVKEVGNLGPEYVFRNHNPFNILIQYVWFYHFIKDGIKIVTDTNTDFLKEFYEDKAKYDASCKAKT